MSEKGRPRVQKGEVTPSEKALTGSRKVWKGEEVIKEATERSRLRVNLNKYEYVKDLELTLHFYEANLKGKLVVDEEWLRKILKKCKVDDCLNCEYASCCTIDFFVEELLEGV